MLFYSYSYVGTFLTFTSTLPKLRRILYNYLVLARLAVMLTSDNWMLGQWAFRPIALVTDPYVNAFRRVVPTWGKIELGPIASLAAINVAWYGGEALGADSSTVKGKEVVNETAW